MTTTLVLKRISSQLTRYGQKSPPTSKVGDTSGLRYSICTFHLSVTIYAAQHSFPLQALISSVTEQVKLPLQLLTTPIPATVFGTITYQTRTTHLVVSGNHRETLIFLIFAAPKTPVILGYPWLEKYNLSLSSPE